jgi:hypothetical protein
MTEAVALGYGRTRGMGNRLEYHWLRNNNGSNDEPPTPDALGNLGKLREELGKGVPYVETTNNQGVQGNLGNLGKGIPNFSLTENMEVPLSSSSGESFLEGGYVPEPSLSTPQGVCDIDPVVSSELENNLGNPFPNPSLSSLSAMSLEQTSSTSPDESEEAIALTPALQLAILLQMSQSWEEVEVLTESVEPEAKTEAWSLLAPEEQSRIRALKQLPMTNCQLLIANDQLPMTNCQLLKVGDRVNWSECPTHCESFSPFVIDEIEGDYAKLDLFAKLVPLVELQLAT